MARGNGDLPSKRSTFLVNFLSGRGTERRKAMVTAQDGTDIDFLALAEFLGDCS